MSAYSLSDFHPLSQYRRLGYDDAALLHRPWPPSPTLAKSQSSPRCPLFLIALPLFLLMTAAPLLSAIFSRPHPPSMRSPPTVATNRHAVHPLSVQHEPPHHASPASPSPPAFSPPLLPLSEWSCSSNVTVHVIFGNHLDVGFRAYNPDGWFAADVIDQALNQWIPDAISFAANLSSFTHSANPHNDTHMWPTHPWLLSLALDCPPHMGYRCPDKQALTSMRRAVADGVISFHGLSSPHRAQSHSPSTALFHPRSTSRPRCTTLSYSTSAIN